MAEINRPMYEHFGARHLGVKGVGAMTTLEEGVMGVLPLDIMSDPIYWNIQGITSWMRPVNQAGGAAGTYAKVGLAIESASTEVIARVLSAHIVTPATAGEDIGIYRCARTAFSSDPGVYGYGTDTRIAEARHSQSIILNGTDNTSPGQEIGQLRTGIDAFWEFPIPLIVSPTQCIYFINWNDTENLTVNLCWAEIPAYKAEL
jgi:hypothetical protein